MDPISLCLAWWLHWSHKFLAQLSVCKIYVETLQNWSSVVLTMVNILLTVQIIHFLVHWTCINPYKQCISLFHHLMPRFLCSTSSRYLNKYDKIMIYNASNYLTHKKGPTNHSVMRRDKFSKLKLCITVGLKNQIMDMF